MCLLQKDPAPFSYLPVNTMTKYLSTLAFALFLFSTHLKADIVGDFDGPGIPTNDPTVVQTIDFDVANVNDIVLEANFFIVDAGIQILVTNQELFATGTDATQFGPDNIFVSSLLDGTPAPPALQFDNLGFGFVALPGDVPRLTVTSDSSGTAFSGFNQQVNNSGLDPTADPTAVNYTVSFDVADFSSLLVADSANTIQILSLNGDGVSRLDGDFSLSGAVAAVPEPSSSALLVLGTVFCLRRRR